MENKHDGSPKATAAAPGSPELKRDRSRSPRFAIGGGSAATSVVSEPSSQPPPAASPSYWPLILIPDDDHYGHQLPAPERATVAAEIESLVRRTCSVCKKLFDSPKAMWGHSWVHRDRTSSSSKETHHHAHPGMHTPPRGGMGIQVGGGGATGGGLYGSGGNDHHHQWVGFGEGGDQQSTKSNSWTIDSQDVRDRTCPRCHRVFNSPKAMYGHLHVHKRGKDEGGGSDEGIAISLLGDFAEEGDAGRVEEEIVNVEEKEIRAVEPRTATGGGKGKEKVGEAPEVKESDKGPKVAAPAEGSKKESDTSSGSGGGGGAKGTTDDSSSSIDLNKPAVTRGARDDDEDSPDSIDLNKTPSGN